jgi:ubiquinone/menaquinone biosynthesis C-methylase UbiE
VQIISANRERNSSDFAFSSCLIQENIRQDISSRNIVCKLTQSGGDLSNIEKNFRESEDYWHGKAHLFSSFYKTIHPILFFARKFLEERQQIVMAYLKKEPNAVVLDVGCGSGEFAEQLGHYYGSVEAVDYSEIMLKLAKQQVTSSNISFQKADCANLPFEANKFDHLFALGLLDYVSDMPKVLKEFYRVSKAGGSLLVTFPKTPSLNAPLRVFSGVRSLIFKLPPIVNALSKKQVEILSEQAGLEIVEMRPLWTTMWIVLFEKNR